MAGGLATRFLKIEQRVTDLERKFEALKTDIEEAPVELQDLLIPKFPHILNEIGYDPPEADRSSTEE